MKKQYFSKLYNEWIDFKSTDCEESLKKYKYKIREIPIEDVEPKLLEGVNNGTNS